MDQPETVHHGVPLERGTVVAKKNAIGLDIGTSGVRGAEISFNRDRITLEKFGQVALPEGAVRDGQVINTEAVSAAIKELWAAARFSHKKVVLGVANQRVIVRQMDMPKMSNEDLKKALPFQVQEFLPMPVEQAVMDFHAIETVAAADGRDMVRGMMVAVARDVVNGHITAAEGAGLQPVMVDLVSFAVLRSLAEPGAGDNFTEAIIDVGSAVTNLVVHENGVPRFVRILMMGGQQVTDHMSERMGIPHADAEDLKQRVGMAVASPQDKIAARVVEGAINSFVDEIRGSIDFYNSSNPTKRVQRVVLSGGGSVLRGLGQRLATELQTTTVAADPVGRVNLGNTGLADEQLALVAPLAAVPLGLAMGAM